MKNGDVESSHIATASQYVTPGRRHVLLICRCRFENMDAVL